jgi:pimeloyl-ACP methyl ester carboxylesterase
MKEIWMSDWTDGYVQAKGIRLHYWRTGGAKPPVVLAHGITDNGLCWSRLARALEGEFDLIMVDARGHGMSDKPATGYTPADHAEDLVGLITALALNKPGAIGHSMGGGSVGVLASTYPDMVGAVVLEDPAWGFRAGQGDGEAARQSAYNEWTNTIRTRQAKTIDQVRAQGRIDNPQWAEEEFEPWGVAKFQVVPQVAEFVVADRSTWRQELPKLKAPLLLVYPDDNRGGIVTSALAAEAMALSPKVQAVQIPDAGHNIRRENFAAYVAAVRDFLRGALL